MPTCPNCGKPIESSTTRGLCPECLLKAGLGGDSSGGSARKFTPPSPQELSRFFPQLEIIALLGRGGMGAVYKARQKNLDRIVALKILPQDIGQDPAFEQRFVREAKALAKLNHPNIITLYEFGQADGYFFFLMEFIDGMNLGELLDAGRVNPREALAIVPQVCDGLQYAHDHGIVHRDIKPANIMLDRRGRVKVADFGLAKLVGGADPASSRASTVVSAASSAHGGTEAGQVLGTPHYMAPEQIERPADVDHRADIYSLGVVIYELLTGELPPAKLEPPSRKYQIDVRLDDVVLRALEKQPDRRYQQASEVKTHMEKIAAAPVAKTGGIGSRLIEQPWQKSALIAAVVMFALLLGVLFLATIKHSVGTSISTGPTQPASTYPSPDADATTPPAPQPPRPVIQPPALPAPTPPEVQLQPTTQPAITPRAQYRNTLSTGPAVEPPKPSITESGQSTGQRKVFRPQIGEGYTTAPQPIVPQNPEPELLRIQLSQAAKTLALLEAQEKAGQIERAKVLDARDNIEVLKAQLAGDQVQAARLKLATAKRQLETAEIMFKRGLIGPLEAQAARDAVELREAELRLAEKAESKSR